MDLLGIAVVACAVFAGAYQLFQVFAAWHFLRRSRVSPAVAPGRLPAVTVLKPLKGPGVELYDNLASFCRQDYPAPVQLVFGVADAHDPAVAVVQRLRRDFPERDIVLSIGDEPGTNRKIANLVHMARHARHDVLVMSDADIRVAPGYLRTLVAPLTDAATGLVTCLYRAVGRLGFPSVVESLLINTDFIPMVLAAQIVQRFRYAYGASIAIRRDALERIGGFAPLAEYLADDYLLGRRVADAGYRLVLLPHMVDTILDSTTLSDVWRHQLRWSRTYRVCQPIPWFLTVVTHATLWGVLSVVATGGSAVGWGALVGTLAIRLGSLDAILRLLGDRETRRHLWIVPAKDLAYSTVWLAAFLGNEVNWGGEQLRVRSDGRMVPVSPAARIEGEPAVVGETESLRATGR
jgi:ceramide glucosyltransferase